MRCLSVRLCSALLCSALLCTALRAPIKLSTVLCCAQGVCGGSARWISPEPVPQLPPRCVTQCVSSACHVSLPSACHVSVTASAVPPPAFAATHPFDSSPLWVWVALTPARSVCSVRSVRSSCSCSGRAHPCPLCPLCLLVVMVVLLVVPHAGFDVLQVVAALTSGLALRQLRYAAASKPTNTYTRHTHTQCFRSQRSIAMIAGRTLSPQTTAGQQERAAAAMQRHTKQRL